jgi:hypothetical protein
MKHENRKARRARIFKEGRRPDPALVVHGQPPDRLYKFMRKCHAEAMCGDGNVRIGTLHEYRDTERYKELTADANEGDHSYSEEVLWGKEDQLSAHVRKGVATLFGVDGGQARVFGSVFTEFGTEPDCYIYCVSKSPSWKPVDSAYDACVEITNAKKFINALRRAVARSLNADDVWFFAKSIVYRPREASSISVGDQRFPDLSPFMPAFTKPKKYEAAREFRVAFVSKTDPSGPILFSDPAIAASCRVHSFRENADDSLG